MSAPETVLAFVKEELVLLKDAIVLLEPQHDDEDEMTRLTDMCEALAHKLEAAIELLADRPEPAPMPPGPRLASDPKNALDYPHSLNDDSWVIWSNSGHTWPDARRALTYLSNTRKDTLRGYGLFTSDCDQAVVFDNQSAADSWVTYQNSLRPHSFSSSIKVTTVRTMKVMNGFATE